MVNRIADYVKFNFLITNKAKLLYLLNKNIYFSYYLNLSLSLIILYAHKVLLTLAIKKAIQ